MFILKKEQQPGVYMPLKALFLVVLDIPGPCTLELRFTVHSITSQLLMKG